MRFLGFLLLFDWCSGPMCLVFMVWSGMELWSLGCSQQPFSCIQGNLGMVTTKRTNKQPSDPRASLLLSSEKAVFAKSGFLYSSCITFRLRVRLWQFCSTLKTLISKFGSLTHWQCLLLSCLGVWTAEIDINNLCAEELVQQYIPDDIK